MPPPPQRVALALLFLLVAAGLVLAACLFLCVSGTLLVPFGSSTPPGPVAEQEPSESDPVKVNIRFGMPAPARDDPASREAYLIERPQYVLSYNADTLTPNWVCWRLRQEDIGEAPRSAFEPDPELPGAFYRVASHDYDGSGFDRGHMCPAKDRSASEEDSKVVFYMTNILPQAPNCNQRGWERLEDYCRRLVRGGHVLWIACGPHGVGGEGKEGRRDEIGTRHKITVPSVLWKVVLVLPAEDTEPRRNSRVISVLMPNDQSVDYDWTRYRTTARQIEQRTGLTFFRTVPEDVAEALRDHLDSVEVHVEHPGHGKEGER